MRFFYEMIQVDYRTGSVLWRSGFNESVPTRSTASQFAMQKIAAVSVSLEPGQILFCKIQDDSGVCTTYTKSGDMI